MATFLMELQSSSKLSKQIVQGKENFGDFFLIVQ